MTDERSAAEQLRHFGSNCAAMGAALYARMAELAAADYDSGGPVDRFFAEDERRARLSSIGIRLLAALHLCALDGSAPALARHFPSCGGDGDATAAWNAARSLLDAEMPRIGVLFERVPQTNEVARSMPLLAGLLAIAHRTSLPTAVFEIGASAGLNTRLDAYRYEGAGWSWGDESSPLVLRNAIAEGRPKALDAPLQIVERRGCDLHPLDIERHEDREELRSFVWPDQSERFVRLDAAIEAARRVPLAIDADDMFAWSERRAQPTGGRTTVVVQSVVAEHLSDALRERWATHVSSIATAARRDAPFAWLRMEAANGTYQTTATLWPEGAQIPIASSNGHAQGIRWN